MQSLCEGEKMRTRERIDKLISAGNKELERRYDSYWIGYVQALTELKSYVTSKEKER
jgi:hypothetical protein